VTAARTGGWDRHPDGTYISVPIFWHDLDEVRAWCNLHCEEDFLVVLDRCVLFQAHEDAALAALRWRCEED